MKSLQLLPAIDVVEGRAVRLLRGEAGTETGYGDPMDVAKDWTAGGATYIHLVDLDAAFGRGDNRELIRRIVSESTVRIELSGGIRDDDSLKAALDAGATRVNLGTAALENPEWTERVIKEYGDKIAVGLDVRGHTLSARGWTRDGGELFEVLDRLNEAGCARYVVTDVAKDGTMEGPNTVLLSEVCARTDAPVIASGGVATLADIEVLRKLTDEGVEGAIVGKALYAGAFTLPEAVEVAGEQ